MTATAAKLKTIATNSILRILSFRKQYERAVEMKGEVLTKIIYKPIGSILRANTRAVKPTRPAMFRNSIWRCMFLGTVTGIFYLKIWKELVTQTTEVRNRHKSRPCTENVFIDILAQQK